MAGNMRLENGIEKQQRFRYRSKSGVCENKSSDINKLGEILPDEIEKLKKQKEN